MTSDEMVKQAVKRGLTGPGKKSRPAIDWLMAEYKLSNAYAMAIIRLLRDRKLLDWAVLNLRRRSLDSGAWEDCSAFATNW